jgi:hypothetical protein
VASLIDFRRRRRQLRRHPDFSHFGYQARRPVGRRVNDDLHTELAEESHPRHLRKNGCVVDGNREK